MEVNNTVRWPKKSTSHNKNSTLLFVLKSEILSGETLIGDYSVTNNDYNME